MSDVPEHVRRNRAAWNRVAVDYVGHGRNAWASDEPCWGIWTAYWSAWLARRGARPVGVDVSERQLETARAFQQEFELEFPSMIRLLRSSGFDVEDLSELPAPEGGSSGQWNVVTLDWARRWPSEEIWVARKP